MLLMLAAALTRIAAGSVHRHPGIQPPVTQVTQELRYVHAYKNIGDFNCMSDAQRVSLLM
jgi:hypothetical protein